MRGYRAWSRADYIPTPVERSKDGRCQPRVCPFSWPFVSARQDRYCRPGEPCSKKNRATDRGETRLGFSPRRHPPNSDFPRLTRGSPGRIARKPIGQPDGVGNRPWPLSKSIAPLGQSGPDLDRSGMGCPKAEHTRESVQVTPLNSTGPESGRA